MKLYLKPQGNNLTLFTQAEKASRRAAELAQQLLTFARGGAPVMKLTTFFLYLPASGKEAFHLEGIEEASPCFGEGRILIMDDQEVVRQILDEMLQELGYQVVSAGDGAEALELYRKGKEAGEPFEAVILDLTVPGGMGGIETMRRLLTIDPEVKAIVSSGYAADPIMANYRQFGFRGAISKPYGTQQLGKVLDEVL